jgi:hypothetical protein
LLDSIWDLKILLIFFQMVHCLFQLHSLKPLTTYFHYRQLFHFFITITTKRKKPNNIKDTGE